MALSKRRSTITNAAIMPATASKYRVMVANSLMYQHYNLSGALPIAFPIAANLVRQRQTKRAVRQRTVVETAVIFKPRRGFTAAFLVQCLEAMGAKEVRLET
jgi:hypothetical protein